MKKVKPKNRRTIEGAENQGHGSEGSESIEEKPSFFCELTSPKTIMSVKKPAIKSRQRGSNRVHSSSVFKKGKNIGFSELSSAEAAAVDQAVQADASVLLNLSLSTPCMLQQRCHSHSSGNNIFPAGLSEHADSHHSNGEVVYTASDI